MAPHFLVPGPAVRGPSLIGQRTCSPAARDRRLTRLSDRKRAEWSDHRRLRRHRPQALARCVGGTSKGSLQKAIIHFRQPENTNYSNLDGRSGAPVSALRANRGQSKGFVGKCECLSKRGAESGGRRAHVGKPHLQSLSPPVRASSGIWETAKGKERKATERRRVEGGYRRIGQQHCVGGDYV
ncbi:unnamed protein product [Pleuronectes platessa]|uniref:Uncharacterized protein n=1 Tax=Pleuronectes platessa TaxID=8262 RepID=A0A9N7UKH3_PLEPL|nr:unnamed protein product [Pleuronectes platessa]